MRQGKSFNPRLQTSIILKGRESGFSQYYNWDHPLKTCQIISKFLSASPAQMIDIFSRINTKEKVDELNAILACMREDTNITIALDRGDRFKEKVLDKLKQSLKLIHEEGLDLTRQKHNDFLKALLLLGKGLILTADEQIIKQIESVLISTQSVAIFKKYLEVLTGYIKYPSKPIKLQTLNTLKQILGLVVEKPENSQEKKLKIYQNYNSFTNQQKVIIRSLACCILSGLVIKQSELNKISKQVEKQLKILINQNDSKSLVEMLAQNNSQNKIFANVCTDVVNFQFNKENKKYESKIISNLQKLQEYLQIIAKYNPVKILERLNQKQITISENVIYCKFSSTVLQYLSNVQFDSIPLKFLQNMKFILNQLLSNKGLVLKSLKGEQNIYDYSAHILKLMVKALRIINSGRQTGLQEIQLCFQENFVKLLVQLLQKNNEAMQSNIQIINDMVQYTYIILERKKLQNKIILQSIVKLCIMGVEKFQKFDTKWRVLKKYRGIIQKWFTEITEDTNKIQNILRKWISSYFSQKCRIEFSKIKYIGLIKPKKEYCEVYSKLLLQITEQFKAQIDSSSEHIEQKGTIQKLNYFIFKLHYAISGNFQLTTAMPIAEILHKIYRQYGHILDQLYHFRTWINHYHQPDTKEFIIQQSQQLSEKLQSLRIIQQKDLDAFQCLEAHLPENYQNKQKEQIKLKQFCQKIIILQNYLDLKNPNLVLPQKTYENLILGLIQPLSRTCEKFYNRVLEKMSQSQQRKTIIRQVLVRNMLQSQRSIYGKLTKIFFDLKMTIRLYLNNVNRIITIQQCRKISEKVGPLLIDILSKNQDQIRNGIQLNNDILSGEGWKKKSRLNYSQTLQESSISQKQRIRINRDHSMSLNIVIPLFKSIKKNFGDYIKCFTDIKNEDFSEHCRFSHQIASELQLKQLLTHTKSFWYAKKKTIYDHSKDLFSIFFLPSIVAKSQPQKMLKYALHLEQISQLFQHQSFSENLLYHLQRITAIYQNKDHNKYIEREIQIMSSNNIPNLDFSQYEVVPIQLAKLKQGIKKLVDDFMPKLMNQLFSDNFNTQSIKKLFQIVQTSKDVKQQNNLFSSFTSTQFVENFIKKGYEILKAVLKKQYEGRRSMQNMQEQDVNQNVNKLQQEIDLEVSLDEQDRTSKQELKLKNKQKMRKYCQTPLYVLFAGLSLADAKNQKLIKGIYQLGVHTSLLKYLPMTKKQVQIIQICSFIKNTLPSFHKSNEPQQIKQVINYYNLICTQITKSSKKNMRCITNLLIDLLKQVKNMRKQQFISQSDILQTKIISILLIIVSSSQSIDEQSTINAFSAILNANEKFQELQMEFKIKSFIFLRYNQHMKKKQSQNDDFTFRLIMKPNYIQISLEDYLQTFSQQLKKQENLFNKISRSIFEGWKSVNKLVYSDGIENLFQSKILGTKFAFYQGNKRSKQFLNCLISTYIRLCQQKIRKDEQFLENMVQPVKPEDNIKVSKQYLKKNLKTYVNQKIYGNIIKKLVQTHQIIIPSMLQIPIKNSNHGQVTFIQWMVYQCLQNLQKFKLDLLIKLMNRNGLILDYKKQQYYCQYVSAIVMTICLNQLGKSQFQAKIKRQNILYLILYCLGVKQFNNLARSTDGKTSMLEQLEKIFCIKRQTIKQVSKKTQNEQHNQQNLLKPKLQISKQNYELIMREPLYPMISQKSKIQKLKNNVNEIVGQSLHLIYRNILISRIMRKNQVCQNKVHDQFLNYDLFINNRQQLRVSTLFNKIQDNSQNLNRIDQVQELHVIIQKTRNQTSSKPEKNQKQAQNILSQIDIEINLAKLSNYYRSKISLNKQKINSQRLKQKFIKTKSYPKDFTQYFQSLRIASISQKCLQRIDKMLERKQIFKNMQNTYVPLRISFEPRQQIPLQFRQRIQVKELTINPLQFIKKLEQIKQNSQDLKKFTRKTQQIQGYKINLQKLNEKEKLLMKNQSYRKLAQMGQFERSKFLLSAKDQFLQSLPSQVYWNVLTEVRLLNHWKKRQQLDKRIQQRQLGNQQMFHRRDKPIKTKKNPQDQIKLKPLQMHEQIVLPIEVIKTNFKLFYQQYQISVKNSFKHNLRLMLQIQSKNTKYKTLTTLILYLKKHNKITQKNVNEQNSLKRSRKEQRIQEEREQREQREQQISCQDDQSQNYKKFKKSNTYDLKIKKILNVIQRNLKNSLFDNKNLLVKRLQTKDFYREVFDEQQILENNFSPQLGFDGTTYYPLHQLLYFALQTNHNLSKNLLKYVDNSLPDILVEKIFFCLINQSGFNNIYNDLQPLSNNPLLKKLFLEKFSLQSPPSFELMGKILKYQFGKLHFMKKLHRQALKNYKPSYKQFLCQIFRLFDEKNEKIDENLIKQYRQTYLKIINELYERKSNIRQNPIYTILKIPNFLDFKAKQKVFRNNHDFNQVQIYDYEDPFEQSINIDQQKVFQSSYTQIMALSARELKRKIGVNYMFQDDGGGIGYFRIWIESLFQHMIDSEIIIPFGKENIYLPNPQIKQEKKDNLYVYKFLGRVLALAVLQEQVYPCAFSKILYKSLLNISDISYEDLKQLDHSLYFTIKGVYKTIQDHPDYDIRQLHLKFAYQHKNRQGLLLTEQLKPNGRNIDVTKQNFKQYVDLALEKILRSPFKLQFQQIKQGFYEIIPFQTLNLFTQNDLQLLISGVPVITTSELKKMMSYSKQFDEKHELIVWFWEIFEESSEFQRAKIVQFIHGSERLPYSMNNRSRSFKISIGESSDKRLPTAMTCGSVVTLPQYSSKQALRRALRIAISVEQNY